MKEQMGPAARIINRNAMTSEACQTMAPLQTVAHGLTVEARLVHAIAARKKKERTAGGKSASDLADSILSGSLPSCATSASVAGEDEFGGDFESAMAVEISGGSVVSRDPEMTDLASPLDFLELDPAQEASPCAPEAQSVSEAPVCQSVENTPRNRSRLKNLLKEIGGET